MNVKFAGCHQFEKRERVRCKIINTKQPTFSIFPRRNRQILFIPFQLNFIIIVLQLSSSQWSDFNIIALLVPSVWHSVCNLRRCRRGLRKSGHKDFSTSECSEGRRNDRTEREKHMSEKTWDVMCAYLWRSDFDSAAWWSLDSERNRVRKPFEHILSRHVGHWLIARGFQHISKTLQ